MANNKSKVQEYMSEQEYNEFLNDTFEKVKQHCDRYGLRCSLIFDQIHIYTRLEEFYFIPNPEGKVKLMHKDGILGTTFHEQFNKKKSLSEIVYYINRHTEYKYNPQKLRREKIGNLKRGSWYTLYYLGIDQGFANLGYCVMDENLHIIEKGNIRTSSQKPLQERLSIIYSKIENILIKYPEIKKAACELLFNNKKLVSGRNKSSSMMKTNMASGVLYLVCQQHGVTMYEYSPLTVKKQLTGNGRAEKEEVEEATKQLTGCDSFKVDHESDATAIAITLIKKTKWKDSGNYVDWTII